MASSPKRSVGHLSLSADSHFWPRLNAIPPLDRGRAFTGLGSAAPADGSPGSIPGWEQPGPGPFSLPK